jgi:hypothetical protein
VATIEADLIETLGKVTEVFEASGARYALLISALLPMKLCELLPRVVPITDRLDAYDHATRRGQVDRFRDDLVEIRQLRQRTAA